MTNEFNQSFDFYLQSNPISKMFEHCRRMHWPEPTFEVLYENVLDQYKSHQVNTILLHEMIDDFNTDFFSSPQGFTLKKTEFTMRCEVQTAEGPKQFTGNAMTKKEAKHNAAAAAWAEFGAGVSSSSISSMLQQQRDGK